MVRPCVARGFVDPADTVLHQCIRPLLGAGCAPGHHGISAHAISLPDRPRPGHLGHQCSHAPGRPVLHRRLILSQTSAGKSRFNYVIDLFLCSRLAAVPSSQPAGCTGAPRAGAVKAGRRDDARIAPMFPGHARIDETPCTARPDHTSGSKPESAV